MAASSSSEYDKEKRSGQRSDVKARYLLEVATEPGKRLHPITKIPNVGNAYKKKRIADVAVSQSPFKVVFKLCSGFTVSPQIFHHNNFIVRIENKIVSLHPITTFTCTTIGTLVVGTTNTNDLVLGYMHTHTFGPRPKVCCANA